MPRHPHTPMTLEGQRALRRTPHEDEDPGLEVMRWGSILGGSALLAYGFLRRNRLTDLFYMGMGAALAYRGLSQSRVVDRSFKRLAMHTGATDSVELAASLTIECPVDEVYSFWQSLDNLPLFLRHVDSVERMDDQFSRWSVRLPTGIHLTWRAEIIDERENELIAWQSVENSDVYNEGYVTFRPVFDGQATEMHVRILYRPPAGKVGARIASFFENLQEQYVREDLRSFKHLMEAGELPTTQGQPSARSRRGNGRMERLMH